MHTYIRKKQKRAGSTYNEEDLQNGLNDVKNGNKTMRGAAAFYHIPRSTLKHYVLGTRGKGNTSGNGKGGGSVPSYLSVEEEQEIAECVKIWKRMGLDSAVKKFWIWLSYT